MTRSDSPPSLPGAHAEYTSAVSTKSPPAEVYASSTRCEVCSSAVQPKTLPPRARGNTCRSLVPMRGMGSPSGAVRVPSTLCPGSVHVTSGYPVLHEGMTTLADDLTDPRSSVRLRAVMAAGTEARPSDLEVLVERCAVEPDLQVREALTWALVRLPAETVVPG